MNGGKRDYKRGGRRMSFFCVCAQKKKKKVLFLECETITTPKVLLELKPSMCIPYDSAIPFTEYTQ